VARSDLVDLSLSMNPFAPDVRPLLARHLDAVADYPDPAAGERSLAEAIGVQPELVVLTPGGSEAIALVAQLVPVGSVRDPEFSLYRRHLRELRDDAPRWRSNPSNPLGLLVDPSECMHDTLVWDEAFHPLATASWTASALADRPAWRLGSLTKLWACPGLRLGYAIAPDDASAQRLRDLRPRWSVNALALAVIDEMLELTDLDLWARGVASSRDDFATRLRASGHAIVDTDVNWLLVENDPSLRERLVPHGVLVRDCSSFGLAGVSRVAVPRANEVDRVVAAFERVADTSS
jgi:threonine-phosphate decarboxylase